MNNCIAGILATIISGVAVGSPAAEVMESHTSLNCVSGCRFDIEITVLSFTLDKNKQQTSMRLKVTSKGVMPYCKFGRLIFQDETGKTYQPGGQLEQGGSFSMAEGGSRTLTALYTFVPSPGSMYTLLSPMITCSTTGIPDITYADLEVTF